MTKDMRNAAGLITGLFLAICVATSAFAFQATVVSVHDGDTLTLDTGQPGADQARDHLAGMTLEDVVAVVVEFAEAGSYE